jgi:glycerol kinase
MEMMRRAAPRVFKRGVQPGENLRCVSEIQSPLGQRFRALGWIECDAHELNVATRI